MLSVINLAEDSRSFSGLQQITQYRVIVQVILFRVPRRYLNECEVFVRHRTEVVRP